MTSSMGSLDPKPWWRSRRAHAAAGPGGSVSVYCEGLSAEAPETGARVLDRVDLGFRAGSVTAIVDPTGVRSRALFRLVAGLEVPIEGRVDVRSRSPRRGDRIGAVALVHELSPLDSTLTVQENLVLPLALTGVLAGAGQFASAIATAGLTALVDEPVTGLSAADRFRLLLARAIVCGGDVVLVEDPVHLPAPDRRASVDLLRVLASHGSTILISTADPEFAALADRAILLRDGRVSADLVAPTEAAVREALGTGAEDPATILGPVPSALPSAIDEDGAVNAGTEADEPVADRGAVSLAETQTPRLAGTPTDESAGTESSVEPAVPDALGEKPLDAEDRSTEGAAEDRPRRPVFHPVTPTPAEQVREQDTGADSAPTAVTPTPAEQVREQEVAHEAAPESEEAQPVRPGPDVPDAPAATDAGDANETGRSSEGGAAASTGPSAERPLPRRGDDPDPITQAIRLLARSGPAHPAHDPDAVFTASDARTAPLPEESSPPASPTPEQAEVIDRARRILEDLPGPIVPED